MTAKNQFYSLVGNVRIAKYDDNGILGNYWNVGNTAGFSVSMDETIIEERGTQTVARPVVATISSGVNTKLSTTLKELNRENLELAIRGKSAAITGGTVTAHAPALTFAQYQAGVTEVILPNLKASAVVVSGADASSITVDTSSADFGVIGLPAGLIAAQFPLDIDYTYGSTSSMGFLTQKGGTYSLRFEGVNTVSGGATDKVFVEFYKVSFTPAAVIDMLASDAAISTMELEGTVLEDSSKTASDSFGQLGRRVSI